MVIKSVSLETVCGITSKLPKNDKPEIAFADPVEMIAAADWVYFFLFLLSRLS